MNPMPLLEMIAPANSGQAELSGTVAFAKAKADSAARGLRSAILEHRYGDAPALATAAML